MSLKLYQLVILLGILTFTSQRRLSKFTTRLSGDDLSEVENVLTDQREDNSPKERVDELEKERICQGGSCRGFKRSHSGETTAEVIQFLRSLQEDDHDLRCSCGRSEDGLRCSSCTNVDNQNNGRDNKERCDGNRCETGRVNDDKRYNNYGVDVQPENLLYRCRESELRCLGPRCSNNDRNKDYKDTCEYGKGQLRCLGPKCSNDDIMKANQDLRCGCGRGQLRCSEIGCDEDDINEDNKDLRCGCGTDELRCEGVRCGDSKDEDFRKGDRVQHNQIKLDQIVKKYRLNDNLGAIVIDLAKLEPILHQNRLNDEKSRDKVIDDKQDLLNIYIVPENVDAFFKHYGHNQANGNGKYQSNEYHITQRHSKYPLKKINYNNIIEISPNNQIEKDFVDLISVKGLQKEDCNEKRNGDMNHELLEKINSRDSLRGPLPPTKYQLNKRKVTISRIRENAPPQLKYWK